MTDSDKLKKIIEIVNMSDEEAGDYNEWGDVHRIDKIRDLLEIVY